MRSRSATQRSKPVPARTGAPLTARGCARGGELLLGAEGDRLAPFAEQRHPAGGHGDPGGAGRGVGLDAVVAGAVDHHGEVRGVDLDALARQVLAHTQLQPALGGGDAGGGVVEFGRAWPVCSSRRSAVAPSDSSARALRSVQRRSPVVIGRLGPSSNQSLSPAGEKLTAPCWSFRRPTRPGGSCWARRQPGQQQCQAEQPAAARPERRE